MRHIILTMVVILTLSLQACVSNKHKLEVSNNECKNFGPQTPRDIDNVSGTNSVIFAKALPISNMNLCNIHFHKNAEHKAKDFSIYAGDGHEGYNSGYKCNLSNNLNKAELTPTKNKICDSEHGSLKPGDTIEVHWVLSSNNVKPAPTLNACFIEAGANPQLRVETQVFTLVNDPNALNFNQMQKAEDLPRNTGTPVEFLGSTTGPDFSDKHCSPSEVTWNIRPKCAKLDINSVGEWCENNVYNERSAHGVRKLITDPALLSKIKKKHL